VIEPTRVALARLWWSLHPGFRGLLLAMLIGVALMGIAVLPIGPPKHVSGVIESFGFGVSKFGSYPTAYVKLSDRSGMVSVRWGSSCRVGSQIHITRQQRLWGLVYTADWPPCGGRRGD